MDMSSAWAFRALQTFFALGLYQQGKPSPFIRDEAWDALRRLAGGQGEGLELVQALRAIGDMEPDSPWLGEADFSDKGARRSRPGRPGEEEDRG
jgi:hypothetical protein